MTTGEKVKFYRLSKGLSQLALEIDAGLSEGNISRIENNTVNPTKETLLRIAEVLKLSIQKMTLTTSRV